MIIRFSGKRYSLSKVQFEYLYWLAKSPRYTVDRQVDFKSRHRASVFHGLLLQSMIDMDRLKDQNFFLTKPIDNERYRLNDLGANILLLAIQKDLGREPTKLRERLTNDGFSITDSL